MVLWRTLNWASHSSVKGRTGTDHVLAKFQFQQQQDLFWEQTCSKISEVMSQDCKSQTVTHKGSNKSLRYVRIWRRTGPSESKHYIRSVSQWGENGVSLVQRPAMPLQEFSGLSPILRCPRRDIALLGLLDSVTFNPCTYLWDSTAGRDRKP